MSTANMAYDPTWKDRKKSYIRFYEEHGGQLFIKPYPYGRQSTPIGLIGTEMLDEFTNGNLLALAKQFYIDRENFLWCLAVNQSFGLQMICSWEETPELGGGFQSPPYTWSPHAIEHNDHIFQMAYEEIDAHFVLRPCSFQYAKLVAYMLYNNSSFIIF